MTARRARAPMLPVAHCATRSVPTEMFGELFSVGAADQRDPRTVLGVLERCTHDTKLF